MSGVQRRAKEAIICLNCEKKFHPLYTSTGKYCSNRCQSEYEYKTYIERWKVGEEDGTKAGITVSGHIRRYLFDVNHNRCQHCGWGEINPYTGKIPLQIHHIDGNCKNNKEDNLQLLCPNCHSLTENYGRRNKNAPAERSKYFGRS